MSVNPALLSAIGDVFINLSAGWFGAAIILPGTGLRSPRVNALYITMNVLSGIIALAIGYKFRILDI